MREKLERFMRGRYGVDELGQFMAKAGIVLLLLNLFLRQRGLSVLILAELFVSYYRMLSRDYNRRYEENRRFLTLRTRALYRFSNWKSEMRQRKTHHIYRCPSCRQKIRVPRGKGTIMVTCPKCRTEFKKKS